MGLLLPLGYFGSALTTNIVNNICNQLQDYRLPGDPAGIRQIAYEYLQPLSNTLGDVMSVGAEVIAAKQNGHFMEGNAADSTIEGIGALNRAMENVQQGIDTVSNALLQWAERLEECQSTTDTAREQAIDYARSFVQWDGERAAAIDLVAVAQAAIDSSGDDEEAAATATSDLDRANAKAQDAEGARNRAGDSFEDFYAQVIQAQDSYDLYAKECALTIAQVLGSPAMTQSISVLQRQVNWVSPVNFSEAMGKALSNLFSPVATFLSKGLSGALAASSALAGTAAHAGKGLSGSLSGTPATTGSTASDALAGMSGNLTTTVTV